MITLKGTVTRFDWLNPHVRFYVDVKDDKGAITNWDLELMSPNTLTRAGWDRHALKVGDQVTVTAYLAKDGSNRANARGNVTLSNGRKIFAGDAVGADNRYGHPSDQVLARLAGDLVVRTDQQGDITISTDGQHLWLDAQRNAPPSPAAD